MTLKDLIERAEKGGCEPVFGVPDKRETFSYMDVTSQHYREEAAKHEAQRRRLKQGRS